MTAKAGKSRSAEIPPPIFTVRSLEEVLAQQQAQHSAMISLIIKNTGKIQKEIGFRRPRLKVKHAIFLVCQSHISPFPHADFGRFVL